MNDFIKSIENSVPIFDKQWQKKQRANDPKFIRNLLLAHVPKGGKYKRARALIKEVCDHNLKVKSFYIARRVCKNRERSLTESDYQSDDKFQQSVENLCKTVRRIIKPEGYTISFQSPFTEILKLK